MKVMPAEAQAARLRELDPRLAGAALPHLHGEHEVERGAGAERAAVGWTVDRLADDDPRRAYTPAVTSPATPLLLPAAADSPAAGRNVAAVLADWRRAVAGAAPDAVLQVTWPSADERAAGLLAAGGFVPGGVFALRAPDPPPQVRPEAARQGTVRRAGEGDLDAAVALHEEELAFHAGLGAADGLASTSGAAARDRMSAGVVGQGRSVVHLVEVAGEPVAVCESWAVEVTASGATGGHSAARLLPHGRYAYLNTVGVTASHRGRGYGALLVASVLRDLADDAPGGTFLWYESGNPVSPGFWRAMGYRPLWTRYQRPAAA